MEDILINLGFFKEEIKDIIVLYKDIEHYKFNKVVVLLKKYKCNDLFIRGIIINKKEVFKMDIDRLEYILDAIVANDDIIEEILFDLI